MSVFMAESKLQASVLPPSPPAARGGFFIYLLVFAMSVLPVVIWPGDVSWINDEPRLIAAAWHANHAHGLAIGGLWGNFSVRYGPLPTQIYQALLLFTHDPIALVVMRSLLCAGVTVFSLLWLARLLRFSPWFAAAVCLAPQVWAFQRMLWDASFGIPLGTLALAALAAFLQGRRMRHFTLALGAALFLPLIHPQGLPLCVGIGGALAWECRDQWRFYRRAAAWTIALVLAPNALYLAQALFLLAQRLGAPCAPAIRADRPIGKPRWRRCSAATCSATINSPDSWPTWARGRRSQ